MKKETAHVNTYFSLQEISNNNKTKTENTEIWHVW